MALFVTHGIFASILTFFWRDKKTKYSVFVLIFVASILPDIDIFFQGTSPGMFSHRGITHSLFFAGMIGVIFSALFLSVVKSFGQSLLLMLIFSIAAASHCCIDAMTDATYGVCFFCPFSDDRYFFPITLFSSYTSGVAHKGYRPGLRGSVLVTLLPEILWIWVPSIAVFMLSYYFNDKASAVKITKPFKPISIRNKETPKPTVKKNSNQKKR